MQITFLGTGGGRFCMIKQIRQTGGFILQHNDFMMAVDPAPGALIYALKNNIELENLDAIFTSHAHLDHYGDLDILIEAMTNGCTEKQGALIANKTLLHGNKQIDPKIDQFHKNNVERIIEAEEGQEIEIKNTALEFQETQHKNVQTTGFKLTYDQKTLGYIPDTEYFPKLPEKFSGIDYLILNVLRPHDKSWKGHLNLSEAVKLVEHIQPEKTLLQHFGLNFAYNFKKEKKWLDKNYDGDNILLASDNARYSLDKQGISRFV